MPRQAFRDEYQRYNYPRSAQCGIRSGHRTKLVQNNSPLRPETDLGYGCERPANGCTQSPGIKQTDSLNICAREERSECAAKNICRREKEHKLNLGRAAQRLSPRFLKIVVQQEPNCDVRSAHEQ